MCSKKPLCKQPAKNQGRTPVESVASAWRDHVLLHLRKKGDNGTCRHEVAVLVCKDWARLLSGGYDDEIDVILWGNIVVDLQDYITRQRWPLHHSLSVNHRNSNCSCKNTKGTSFQLTWSSHTSLLRCPTNECL